MEQYREVGTGDGGQRWADSRADWLFLVLISTQESTHTELTRRPDVSPARHHVSADLGSPCPWGGLYRLGHRWWWLDKVVRVWVHEEVQRPKADNTAPKFSPTAGNTMCSTRRCRPLSGRHRPSSGLRRPNVRHLPAWGRERKLSAMGGRRRNSKLWIVIWRWTRFESGHGGYRRPEAGCRPSGQQARRQATDERDQSCMLGFGILVGGDALRPRIEGTMGWKRGERWEGSGLANGIDSEILRTVHWVGATEGLYSTDWPQLALGGCWMRGSSA